MNCKYGNTFEKVFGSKGTLKFPKPREAQPPAAILKEAYLLTQRQKWDRKPVPLHHHLETVQYMNDFSNDQHNVFLKYLAIRYMELIIKRNSKPYQFI